MSPRPRVRRRLTGVLTAAALVLGVAGVPLLTAAPVTASTATAVALPDGAVVREENSFAIFQMIGGAKIWIPTADEFSALGYTLDRVVVVPAGGLASVPTVPVDGTLMRERTSFAIFIMEGGQRRWITEPAVFYTARFTLDQVHIAANGSLGSLPAGPDWGLQALDTTASGSSDRCGTNSEMIAEAASARSANFAGIPDEGWRSWYVTVQSHLWTCGGYVYAKHYIWLDSRALPLGFKLVLRVSTKRSDGVWVGTDYEVTAAKRYQTFNAYQYRGVGGGLRLTDVHLRHFPAPGQASFFKASTAKAQYVPYNGPHWDDPSR